MALFIDRSHEFEVFDRALTQARRRGQLFLIHGRPGAGKTTLIHQWLSARRKRALVWTPQAGGDELEQVLTFAQALGRFLKRAPVPTGPYASEVWRAAFHQLAEAAVSQRQIVVIDQATDLMPQYSALVNGLKQAWDQELKDRAVLVILVGDHGARIFEHLRSYSRAPLYGRFTAIWRLDPLPWADFSAAFRRWPLRERLLAYAVTGGWPLLLNRVAEDLTGHDPGLRPDSLTEVRPNLMDVEDARRLVEASGVRADDTVSQAWDFLVRTVADEPVDLDTLVEYLTLVGESDEDASDALTVVAVAHGAVDVVAVHVADQDDVDLAKARIIAAGNGTSGIVENARPIWILEDHRAVLGAEFAVDAAQRRHLDVLCQGGHKANAERNAGQCTGGSVV